MDADLCDYFALPPEERLRHAEVDLDPDATDDDTDDDQAELQRLGVNFEEVDDMIDPNVQDDPQEWDHGGFAHVEGAPFPDDDDPEWDYDDEEEDDWDDWDDDDYDDWWDAYDDWDDEDDDEDWP